MVISKKRSSLGFSHTFFNFRPKIKVFSKKKGLHLNLVTNFLLLINFNALKLLTLPKSFTSLPKNFLSLPDNFLFCPILETCPPAPPAGTAMPASVYVIRPYILYISNISVFLKTLFKLQFLTNFNRIKRGY